MTEIVNITEARQRFTDLVRELGDEPIYVTVYGKPQAVVIRYEVFEALLEKMENLEDSLEVLMRRGGPTRDFEEVMAELEGVSSPA